MRAWTLFLFFTRTDEGALMIWHSELIWFVGYSGTEYLGLGCGTLGTWYPCQAVVFREMENQNNNKLD